MTTLERFDDAELALIAAEFERDAGDDWWDDVDTGARRRLFCGPCGRWVAYDRQDDAPLHAPGCAGVARRRIAAKARALQQGAGAGR